MNEKISSVDEYILAFPKDRQCIMQKIRAIIKAAAPEAIEKIAWNMPTYWQKENLIHFACAKKHIGIYPGAQAVIFFQDRLAEYKTSKGAIQLPLSKPIPYELIEEITAHRVKQVTT